MPLPVVIPLLLSSVLVKKSVYKVLKTNPEEFRDLVLLADCDVEDSLPTCRKLVARLYDQKGKQASGHSDLISIKSATGYS